MMRWFGRARPALTPCISASGKIIIAPKLFIAATASNTWANTNSWSGASRIATSFGDWRSSVPSLPSGEGWVTSRKPNQLLLGRADSVGDAMTQNDALAAYLGPQLFARLEWSRLNDEQRDAI